MKNKGARRKRGRSVIQRGVGARSGPGSRPQDSITPQQWAHGLGLYQNGIPADGIQVACQLTRPQLLWLIRIGDEERGMPAWITLQIEQAASARARAHKAGEALGQQAVGALEAFYEAAKEASDVRRALQMLRAAVIRQTLEDVQAGKLTPAQALRKITPGQTEMAALKDLDRMADIGRAGEAFRKVFESPHRLDPVSGQPRGSKIDLSNPTVPALVSTLSDGVQETHDPLADAFPEFKDWTTEDIERWMETGEVPRVALPPPKDPEGQAGSGQ